MVPGFMNIREREHTCVKPCVHDLPYPAILGPDNADTQPLMPEENPEEPSLSSTVDVGMEWEDHGKRNGIAEAQLEVDKARTMYFQAAKAEEKAEQAEVSKKQLENKAALDKACSTANTESSTADPKNTSLQVHNKWATRHDLKLQSKPGTAHADHEQDSKNDPPKPESFGHTAFLSPDEQCPPKKRGRKPKESTATGGSKGSKVDEGESSKTKTRGRSRVRKSKVDKAATEENEAPPTKRPRKKSTAGKDAGSVKKAPKRVSLPEGSPSDESPTTAKKDSPASRMCEYLREARKARLARMDADETPQHEESGDGTKTKKTRKSRKAADVTPCDEKPKKTRKSRKAADVTPRDEKPKNTRKSRKTDKPENAPTKVRKTGAAKTRKEKPDNKPAKKTTYSAEKKAELSRKSSAYHVAFKHTEGTEEEKRAAARKVL